MQQKFDVFHAEKHTDFIIITASRCDLMVDATENEKSYGYCFLFDCNLQLLISLCLDGFILSKSLNY